MEQTKSKRKKSSQANDEIDSRLAQAIRDRAKAMQMVSKLVHWQDRLARLEQEINSLIGFQQRLYGRSEIPYQMPDGRQVDGSSLIITNIQPPTPFTGHLSPIPDGVTSIPTKVANPKPSGGNMADIAGEGGFS